MRKVGLFFLVLFSFSFSHAQEPVAPLTSWLATVEEPSQQIVLSWAPGADSLTMGYHICTGSPCLAYDSVIGRYDTTYRCLDHLATIPHTYRLHVFDSAHNVSALTPYFGNMVLSAAVPRCATHVEASWTPYDGMPGGVAAYRLFVRLEPYDTAYVLIHSAAGDGPYAFSFDIAESVTRVWLKVQAVGYVAQGTPLVSQSNVVSVERLTVDTVAFLDITDVEYDSLHTCNRLTFRIDTAFHTDHYTLYRSVDGSPWDSLAALSFSQPPFRYVDNKVNPYDSLHCYQLAVPDACGLNPRYSDTRCVVVPTPPSPASAFPNVLVAGDPANGTFRPVLRGLKGNLYELYIYNRLGLLVFSTTDPAAEWTPAANSPQGVYTYSLRCRFNNNQVKTYTGTILVLK